MDAMKEIDGSVDNKLKVAGIAGISPEGSKILKIVQN